MGTKIKQLWNKLFKKRDIREMTEKDIKMAMIGAIVLQELHDDRTLRRKLRGTQLEQKLKYIIRNDF
jgi:hypothetical protein